MDPVAGLIPVPGSDASRVSLRRRLLDGAAGEPAAGDVVGILVEEGEDRLVVLPDDRGPVTVGRPDVVALRRIPARPVRPSSSPESLSRFAGEHWPGIEAARLGGWVLRAGDGFTRRANSCLVTGDPGCDARQAEELVVDWYRARELPPRLRVLGAPGESVPWPGWTPVDDVVVLVGDLRALPAVPAPGVAAATDRTIEIGNVPSAGWLDLWRGGSGHDAAARAVLTSCPAAYVLLRSGTTAVACARVVTDRRWAHVSCVEVAPAARGGGLGREIVDAALGAARSGPERVDFVVVEVEQDNAAARRIYDRLGLRVHHRYHYQELRWRGPTPGRPGHVGTGCR